MKKKLAVAVIDDALAKVENLLAASQGDESRCTIFRRDFDGSEFTEEQKAAIRRYVASWIEPSLQAAYALVSEQEDWRVRRYAEQVGGWNQERSSFGRKLDEAVAESIKAGDPHRDAVAEVTREVF